MMRCGLILFCVVVTLCCCAVGAEEKKPKVQIGVKKKVDNCTYRARNGDELSVHYEGRLKDGSVFDSSYERNQPLKLTLGSRQVILGWEQGLLGMCENEKRKLIIPPELGYGSSGAPPKIPGDSTLIFEVELVKIERKEKDL